MDGAFDHASMVVATPTFDTIQLYESSESDANILGLTVLIGNTKHILDNGRGYSNWMRITIPLTSPTDYEKTVLMLLPDHPSFLQLAYHAISTAITQDFKHIEAQMEAEVYDSNEKIIGFISNMPDRIVGQEVMLAKMESTIKSKIPRLPIDPTTGKTYSCNNYHWQGSTHDDKDIGELYLCPYKNVVPIKPDEIQNGGVDVGVTPINCGCCYYKSWIIPVFGQDSDKLAEKFAKKEAMNLQDKADKALAMLNTLNLGGV